MGRTTPSFRMAVYKELDRLLRIVDLMPEHEKRLLHRLLDGLEDTLSLYTHTAPPSDPLEVIVVHMLRRLAGELYGCRGMDTRCRTL